MGPMAWAKGFWCISSDLPLKAHKIFHSPAVFALCMCGLCQFELELSGGAFRSDDPLLLGL
jgi:hypothetical protein